MLGREHRIDVTRVYLLGHSMGAGAAALPSPAAFLVALARLEESLPPERW